MRPEQDRLIKQSKLIPAALDRLKEVVEDLPTDISECVMPLIEATIRNQLAFTEILHEEQDNLSDLRMEIKFALFDLEFTRKERDELKSRYENR